MPSTWHTIKTNYIKNLDYWSRDMLNSDFLVNVLEVSPPHFVHDFSRKLFLMLYSINWPNIIAWLLLLFEVLGNMFIVINYLPGCDVINFEINLNFLISFSTWPRSQNKNLNIFRTKRAFKVKLKAFFIICKGLSLAKNCLRPESVPLNR